MPCTLITGVNGFVGLHLVEHLHRLGHTLIGLSRSERGENQGLLTRHYPVGLDDVATLRRILETERVDMVVHLAGVRSAASAEALREANVPGTGRLLEACAQTRISRVLLAGSSAVYGGGGNGGSLDEQAAIAPTTAYGEVKSEIDQMALKAFQEQALPTIRLRPFNIIGPRQRGDYVTARCAQQIVDIERGRKPPVVQLGSLDGYRDFLDVRDLVRAISELLLRGRAGEAYNICSGRAASVRTVIENLVARSTAAIRLKTMLQSDAGVAFQLGSFVKLFEETGWKPEIDLETTIDQILDDWRTDAR